MAGLAGHERIIGVKEARPEPERMQALPALRGRLRGAGRRRDRDAYYAGRRRRVISVVANVVPAAFRLLCELARRGDAVRAAALDARLAPLYAFAGVEPNPIPVKALLARRGIGHGLRLPLTTLAPEHADAAVRMLALADEIEQACRDTLAA